MADNFTPATDASVSFASDEVGTTQFPIVKLDLGANGASAPVVGSVPVSAASLPLPTGAATETTLANIDADIGAAADAAASSDTGTFSLLALIKRLLTKVPAVGQAAMAASLPVVIASNQTAVPIVESSTILTGAAAQTATVNNILENPSSANGTDVSNFRSASVQVVSTGTGGTFIFEQSNDNASWIALPVYNAALVTGVPITAAITATASQIIYTIPLRCRFLRLRIATTITGGSIQTFSRLSTESWTPSAATVAQPTAANLQATVTGTVNPSGGALAAGTNAIGDVGVQYRASATGAATPLAVQSLSTTAATSIKATAGRLIGWQLQNSSAGLRSVKVFAVNAPTMGTTAASFEIDIPAGGRSEVNLPGGIGYGTAHSYAVTSAKGLTDNTATGLAANDVSGAFYFA